MKVIFGVSHVPDANGVMQHTLNNPNAPSVLAYAWIGPFVGAAVRPLGGWISDKVGGSIVTQVISVVMVLASVAVGYVMMQAYASATPEMYFPMFLGLFSSVLKSGDGKSPETAFVVIAVDEEYSVLETASLTPVKQALVNHGGSAFDRFEVKLPESEKTATLFFNVDRPRAQLARTLQNMLPQKKP